MDKIQELSNPESCQQCLGMIVAHNWENYKSKINYGILIMSIKVE
jgi:DNA-directed RNA polymerase subunit N (RpoN/RPB10)